MAIQVVATTFSSSAGGNTNSFTVPTVQDDDILVAFSYFEESGGTALSLSSIPSGYTQGGTVQNTGSTPDLHVFYHWKRAVAADSAATHSFVSNGSWKMGSFAVVREADNSGDPNNATALTATGNSTTATHPTITPSSQPHLELTLAGCFSDSVALTAPSGMTEDVQGSGTNISSLRRTVTSATGSRSTGISSTQQWATIHVLLTEQAGGTMTPITIAGTLTTAGAATEQVQKSLAGTLATAAAAVQKQDNLIRAGTLSSAGALTKDNAQAAFGGTLATAGALLKSSTRSLAGTLTSAGAFVGTKVLLLARSGGLTPAGAISRLNALVRAGTLASSGVIQRVNAQAPFTGTLTTAGALASIKAKLLSFAGSLSSAGALTKRPAISRAGTAATAGAVVKTTGKAAGGTLTTSATLDAGSTGPILVGVSGALTTAGAFAKTTGRLLAGTLASAGAIKRAITRIIQAALSPTGALTKSSTRRAGATVGLGGGLASSRVLSRSYAGTLTLGGAADQEYTRAPSSFQANGILFPTGTVLVDLQHVPIPKPPEAMLVLPETDPPEPIGR